MHHYMIRLIILAGFYTALNAYQTHAQQPSQSMAPQSMPASQTVQQAVDPAEAGPHGGSLKQVAGLEFETLVSVAGITVHVRDRAGQAVSVRQSRGVAMLSIEGTAKRYRYDLLPDSRGALTAPINLSKMSGLQIALDMQIIGLAGQQSINISEVATVPASQEQLTAAAIAIQKVCPVTNKGLGSMGTPVAVEIEGQKVYLCCAGCTKAVEANPDRYLNGRLDVTLVEITDADQPLIARQVTCPVMDEPLGSMGGPIKVLVGDKPLFLCCRGCIRKVRAEPLKFVSMTHGAEQASTVPAEAEQVRAGVYKVSAADAPYIAAQQLCPVMDEALDAMGGPYRVHANGRAIYICCPGCAKKITAQPQKYLEQLTQQGIQPPLVK